MIHGFTLHGFIHLPDQIPAPCVICCHGLFSSMASPKFESMAEKLAARGMVAIRFDHRGCGISDGNIEATTVSSRIEDLEAVYRYARQLPLVNGTFGLFGSSMGGYISLFTAARHRTFSALAVWSTPLKIDKRKKAVNGLDDYPLLDDGFYADLKRHRLIGHLAGVTTCLVLHGQRDELVPLWHALKIYRHLGAPKMLEIIPKADHRFMDADIRRKAMRRSVDFLHSQLG